MMAKALMCRVEPDMVASKMTISYGNISDEVSQ